MYWKEKIDVLKKNYTKKQFDVINTGRKEVLRKIENKFIKRPENYYFSNAFSNSFANWWDNLKETKQLSFDISAEKVLSTIIRNDTQYWVACEFETEILIYKANIEALLSLCAIGRTWVKRYHIIDLKYNEMISIEYEKWNRFQLRLCGNNSRFSCVTELSCD